jgi:hypothetical protein
VSAYRRFYVVVSTFQIHKWQEETCFRHSDPWLYRCVQTLPFVQWTSEYTRLLITRNYVQHVLVHSLALTKMRIFVMSSVEDSTPKCSRASNIRGRLTWKVSNLLRSFIKSRKSIWFFFANSRRRMWIELQTNWSAILCNPQPDGNRWNDLYPTGRELSASVHRQSHLCGGSL